MAGPGAAGSGVEGVESFRRRARGWLAANLPPARPTTGALLRGHRSDEDELEEVARQRDLQRRLFEGGFAGICMPTEYGGQGLTPAHQEAFNEELVGYDYPSILQVPTMTPCAAVLLEFGSEELKRRHLPAILRGDEIWSQLLSEPSGGSDAAGAQTTAVRDGDEWVLNGSKIWTSGAWWSDWGLCLARTNWDVPKHRGLTVFVLPLHQPAVEIHRIEMVNGSREFCQEFLTDVRVPDGDRVGDVDGGWSVGTRWMYHERTVAGGSPYVTRATDFRLEGYNAFRPEDVLELAAIAGREGDPGVLELVGEARTLGLVEEALSARVAAAIAAGALPDQAAAITRLFHGTASARVATIGYQVGGDAAVAWGGDDDTDLGARAGIGFLMRQATSIAGGTVEMARNVIAERVMGMPREVAADRHVPFRQVPRGAPH
ncbi:MAG TPA: acyl-CoA dehydrogenase family protein [Acidimicrobiales bacterium]|nr:acyl-CoA dehydrogenase family protein [Acidimicrobiales bacterium]